MDHLFERLWDNTDDTDRRIATPVLDRVFTKLEDGVLDQAEGTDPWIASWARVRASTRRYAATTGERAAVGVP